MIAAGAVAFSNVFGKGVSPSIKLR